MRSSRCVLYATMTLRRRPIGSRVRRTNEVRLVVDRLLWVRSSRWIRCGRLAQARFIESIRSANMTLRRRPTGTRVRRTNEARLVVGGLLRVRSSKWIRCGRLAQARSIESICSANMTLRRRPIRSRIRRTDEARLVVGGLLRVRSSKWIRCGRLVQARSLESIRSANTTLRRRPTRSWVRRTNEARPVVDRLLRVRFSKWIGCGRMAQARSIESIRFATTTLRRRPIRSWVRRTNEARLVVDRLPRVRSSKWIRRGRLVHARSIESIRSASRALERRPRSHRLRALPTCEAKRISGIGLVVGQPWRIWRSAGTLTCGRLLISLRRVISPHLHPWPNPRRRRSSRPISR